jgi:hypothetical protein
LIFLVCPRLGWRSGLHSNISRLFDPKSKLWWP